MVSGRTSVNPGRFDPKTLKSSHYLFTIALVVSYSLDVACCYVMSCAFW